MALPQGGFYVLLGKNIRKARRAADITQAQLADAIELTRTSVTNIEQGRQPIPIHVLVKIAKVVNQSLIELIPPEASLASDIEAKINPYPSEQKRWIARIISVNTEKADAAKISVRKKKSS